MGQIQLHLPLIRLFFFFLQRFLLDLTIRRRFREWEESEEKTVRIDSPSSHYTLDWILDYLKVAEGQAPACSLLALNDFNTQHCIRQLLQSPVHTPATTPVSHLLFTTVIKLKKKGVKACHLGLGFRSPQTNSSSILSQSLHVSCPRWPPGESPTSSFQMKQRALRCSHSTVHYSSIPLNTHFTKLPPWAWLKPLPAFPFLLGEWYDL